MIVIVYFLPVLAFLKHSFNSIEDIGLRSDQFLPSIEIRLNFFIACDEISYFKPTNSIIFSEPSDHIKIVILVSILYNRHSLFCFRVNRMEINLVKDKTVIRMFDTPFTNLSYLLWRKYYACRIVRADNHVPFFPSLIRSLNTFEKSTFGDGPEVENCP